MLTSCVRVQQLTSPTLTPNFLLKTRCNEWQEQKKGARGLDRKIHKLIAQVVVDDQADVVSNSLAVLTQLIKKFDIYVPSLRRKMQSVSGEWMENELLKSQFDRIGELAHAR